MGDSRWRAVAPLALTLILNTNTADAKWVVSPDIGLRELYSDNPTLATTDRRSDLITQITPAIRVDGSGARFKASLYYSPSAIFYAHHSSEDRVANNLQALGTLEAAEKFFFVDVNGNISQGFISPLGAQPTDITTISSNRLEARTYAISPYVRGQAGSAFSYELRNRNTWTNTNSNALANIHATQWAGRATSPISLFGWGLEYDQSEISYTSLDRPDYSSKLYRGRLYYQPDVDLRLSASAGREENNYVLQQQQSYYIRGVGALWKPGPRTTADLEYERRFFGPSRLARLEHRTRLTAWTLAYSRNGSNYQQELLRLPAGNTAALLDAIFAARITDPAERQAAVEQFMRASGTPAFLSNPLAFYTQQIFLQERLEASVGIVGKRNSVIFTGFRSKTTSLSSSVGAVVSDAFSTGSQFTQRGFGVNASHQLTAFTTLGASARRTLARQEEPATGDTRNDYLTLSLTQTLSPKTTTFAGLSYTRLDSSPAASAYGNARSAFVGLNHRF
jgi:uncharacterized protein (PEP-CTERM system associated)